MQITLPPELADRLYQVARRLKRAPDECALSAVRAFIADCEESFAHAAQLGDGIARIPDEGFLD